MQSMFGVGLLVVKWVLWDRTINQFGAESRSIGRLELLATPHG
jgi:hypothetical protein